MNSLTFSQLGIQEELIKNLNNQKIFSPTEVQEEVIPPILEGKDIICQAPTGSGKTLAFLLPIITGLDLNSKNLQVIILAPTRELAIQIYKVVSEIGPADLKTASLLGGANIERQIDNLKRKPQLVVGTPGRVLELVRKRKINGQQVKTIVIDEGDKMLDLGFKQDILAIIKATLKERQLLLFSATISNEVRTLAQEIMDNSQIVDLTGKSRTAETIKHGFVLAEEKDKADILKELVGIIKPKKIIVFINHNEGVQPLVRRFNEAGLLSEALHSDLSQLERKNVLEQFRADKFNFLVTTDLFARGMDIEGVDLIINFDVPPNEEFYIHRVGRTGRAGKEGTAITLVTEQQKFIMHKYEKLLTIIINQYGISQNKLIDIKKIVERKREEKRVKMKTRS